MNWIKTEDALPEFGKNVLLSENNKCVVGKLISINTEGDNWSTNGAFNFSGKKVRKIKKFEPTHWCEIILPE